MNPKTPLKKTEITLACAALGRLLTNWNLSGIRVSRDMLRASNPALFNSTRRLLNRNIEILEYRLQSIRGIYCL